MLLLLICVFIVKMDILPKICNLLSKTTVQEGNKHQQI